MIVSTLDALLRSTASLHPDRDAVVSDGEAVSYAELLGRTLATAAVLSTLGIGPGDRVGVLLPNGAGFVRSLFACSHLGAVLVPLNPRCTPKELAYFVEHADLRAIVTTADPSFGIDETLVDALPSLARASTTLDLPEAPGLRRIVGHPTDRTPWMTSHDDVLAALPLDARSGPLPGHGGSDDALILYTSGTTAAPKGCRLRHDALLANARAAASMQCLELTSDDRLWNPLPMFHTGGIMPMLAAMTVGASTSTSRQFEAPAALDLIEGERITVAYPAFPAIYGRLLDELSRRTIDARSLRAIAAVGNHRMLQELRAGFPEARLLNMYGATETTGIICYSRPEDDDETVASSCGRPFDAVAIKIVDVATGEDVAAGADGEILVGGYPVFAGYHADADATASAIVDGWFHTGDLGHLDVGGRLTFSGRIKEMLKVGGENVSPLEIESCLMEHPAVRLAAVVGRADDRWGDVVVAFVEIDAGIDASIDELGAHCADRLSKFKVPREFHVVTHWPMSATKVQKSKLLELLR